jgi:hypothetical protein
MPGAGFAALIWAGTRAAEPSFWLGGFRRGLVNFAQALQVIVDLLHVGRIAVEGFLLIGIQRGAVFGRLGHDLFVCRNERSALLLECSDLFCKLAHDLSPFDRADDERLCPIAGAVIQLDDTRFLAGRGWRVGLLNLG